MSFIKRIITTSFSVRKSLSSFFILLILVPSIFFAIPAKKSYALFGVGDTVIEIGPLLAISYVTAAATVVTGVATPVSAATDVIEEGHQFFLKALAWFLAKMILQSITAQTVNWINSGFKGNPAYLTNPDVFFTQIGDQAVVSALSASGHNTLLSRICSPFQPYLRIALAQQYLQGNRIGQCSLLSTVKNYDAFTKNFLNGGWEAWISVTQNMQNNPTGAYLAAKDELDAGVANQQNKYQQQLNWGQGFLSYEKCDEQVVIRDNIQHCIDGGNDPLTCEDTNTNPGSLSKTCETVTPGSVIGGKLNKTLGLAEDQLNLVNDINQLVGALMTQAVKGIVGGVVGGLRGLTQSNTSQPNSRSIIQQMALQSTPGTPEAQAQASSTLSTITAGLPASLKQATDPTNPTLPLTPTIDKTAIQAEVDQDIATYQLKHSTTTPTSGP